jgi:hypothetical protein
MYYLLKSLKYCWFLSSGVLFTDAFKYVKEGECEDAKWWSLVALDRV